MAVRRYLAADFDAVDALWREAFPDDAPWNRAAAAIPEKIAFQPDWLFVAVDADLIIGTVMAGYDGHRGWLHAVAVSARYRRTGVGRALVRTAEAALRDAGCRKVNLQVRTTNAAVVGFYRSLGYAVEDRVSLGRRL